MRAHEFITEWKVVDRMMAGKELAIAVQLFQKLRSKYKDDHRASADAANQAGVRPRVLQDYLIDNGLIMESILTEGYIAYGLDKKSRQRLAAIFPPKYSDFIGHHITYRLGTKGDKLPSMPKSVTVVGYADDGDSIEALVVEINGKLLRPDGQTYHITWSLDRSKGRKPMHSKALVAGGYTSVEPISIQAKPDIFK